MARVIAEEGAGAVVPPGDAKALSAAVRELLADEEGRRLASEAGRRWATGRTWNRVATPLLEYAASPWRDTHRERFDQVATGPVAGDEPLLRRIQRALRRQRDGR